MLTSVVIPVYNGAETIARTVESILAQVPPVDEVVVVNDGSTDATLERIPRDERVRVITQPNGGEGAARNSGIAAARGELVFFVDADDYWLPGHVEAATALYRRTGGRGVLYGNLYTRRAKGRLKRARWWGGETLTLEGYLLHLLIWRTPVSASSVAANRALWERFGLRFDPDFAYGADLNMWMRALSCGPGFISQANTVLYDRDAGQLMNSARSNMLKMPDYFRGVRPSGFRPAARVIAALFALKQAFFIGLSTDMAALEIPESLRFIRRWGLALPYRFSFLAGRAVAR
jgi:glycosyltransferase involved in cell wall biosynthesis